MVMSCSSAPHNPEHFVSGSILEVFTNAFHLECSGYLKKLQQQERFAKMLSGTASVVLHPLLCYGCQGGARILVVAVQGCLEVTTVNFEGRAACLCTIPLSK